MGQTRPSEHIPQDKLGHGTAADIAVTNEHDANNAVVHWSLSPFPASFAVRGVHQAGGQVDDEANIVRLNISLVSSFTTAKLAAFFASGNDDIPLLGIGLGRNRLQLSSAGVGTVARVDVHVKRPQTEGTMIPRGIAQGKHFPAAMGTGEAVVKF